jgi:hypothetical protein
MCLIALVVGRYGDEAEAPAEAPDARLGLRLAGALRTDAWQHVAVVVAGRQATLFVNGEQVMSSGIRRRIAAQHAATFLGGVELSTRGRFHGHLHELAIFRRAISPEDVTLLSQEGKVTALTGERPDAITPSSATELGVAAGETPESEKYFRPIGHHENMWDAAAERLATCLPGAQVPQRPQHWGYKLSFIPIYPPNAPPVSTATPVSEVAPLPTPPSHAPAPPPAQPLAAPRKSVGEDTALVWYVNQMVKQRGLGLDRLLSSSWADLLPGEPELANRPALRRLVEGRVGERCLAEVRFEKIHALNRRIAEVLPLIDIAQLENEWSIAYLVFRYKGLIYTAIKETLWLRGLDRTTSGERFEVTLSRPRAGAFRATGRVDKEGRFTVFSQAFRQLHPLPPMKLRQKVRDRSIRPPLR